MPPRIPLPEQQGKLRVGSKVYISSLTPTATAGTRPPTGPCFRSSEVQAGPQPIQEKPALSARGIIPRGRTMVDQPDPLIANLVQRLYDADPVARRNAVGALRLYGERAVSAISELSRLLADEDAKVRVEAQRALDRLRQAAA